MIGGDFGCICGGVSGCGVGASSARSSSGTMTLVPQNEHVTSLWCGWAVSDAPHDGQAKVWTVMASLSDQRFSNTLSITSTSQHTFNVFIHLQPHWVRQLLHILDGSLHIIFDLPQIDLG